jgi:DNA-directed RNA polymerase subunit RPC12/RpoP
MRCLSCGTPIRAVTPADPEDHNAPSEGAVFVCTACGHLMSLTQTCELRELSNAEMQDAMMDDGLRAALAMIGKSRLS